MSSMNRRNTVGLALVVLAVILFTLPAFFPVQAVLTHNTGPGSFDSRAELEENGVEIIGYENMSERGQELYRQTLEAGGSYSVSQGNGATDFGYLTGAERQVRTERPRQRPSLVAIERPEDASLPPADEPFERVRGGGDESGDEQRRQQVQRYDLMDTSTEPPSLGALSQLLRLAAALLGVLSLCVGGYLYASN